MADSRSNWRRGVLAAESVLLGTLVGAGVNLLSGGWNWPLAAGLLTAVAAWAVLEWYRAVHDSPSEAPGQPEMAGPPGGGRSIMVKSIMVKQSAGRVAGRMTGVRGGLAASETISVDQRANAVESGGEVTGYTDGS